MAKIGLKSNAFLNIKDINNTLNFKANLNTKANKKYLNQILKDYNVTIDSVGDFNINSSGNMKKLRVNFDFEAKAHQHNFTLNPIIKNSFVNFSILKNTLDGKIDLKTLSSMANLKTITTFSLNLKKLDSLKYNSSMSVRDTNIKGVNLKQLEPINFKAKGTKNSIDVKLWSPKIKINAESRDFQTFDISIDSKKIDISKIVKLPKEVLAKLVKIKAKGDYNIKNQNGYIDSKITINKNFNLDLKAKIKNKKLSLNFTHKALKVMAKGKIKPLNIKSEIEIKSILALQKELKKIYFFEKQKIDGKIILKVNIKKENIDVELTSKKIGYEDKIIKNILLKSHYQNSKILLENLNFTTFKFKEKNLNRSFSLTKKGIITLGEKINFDIAFNNMLNIKGYKDKNSTLAKVEIIKFPLEFSEYGNLMVNSKITFKQKNKKSYLQGEIDLIDMNINYEPKTMGIDSSKDIIIITKKSKMEKKFRNKKQKSNFEKNFFINLKINTPDSGRYKVDGAEINFMINLAINKEFGKGVTILGQINKIDGFYKVMGKNFIINEKSTISFMGLKEINPLLDISLKYELAETTIYITVTGDKYHPKIKFSSTPIMSKKDIFSYLLFGTSSDKIGQKKGGDNKKVAELFIANALTKDIAKNIGVDKIKLTEGKGGEGIDIEVGKRINKKLMMIIKNSGDKNSIKLEYDINKNWGIDTQTKENANSINIFYKREYR